MINTKNINEARKQIDSLSSKNEKIIVMGQDENFNKKILENKKVDMLIINENLQRKDYMRQRDSGLNESYCNFATKNKIQIGIDIDEILKKNDIEKAKSLARLQQNIMLCKKSKIDLILLSKKDKKMLSSILLVLGASTIQAKKAVQ